MAESHFRTVIDLLQKPFYTEVIVDTATNDPEWVGSFLGGFMQSGPNLFKPHVKVVLRDFRGTKPE